ITSGSTCRSARSGTATSCGGSPSARPTSRSSCGRWPSAGTSLCARLSVAWRVHDDGDTDQADEDADAVPSVWPKSVEGHAPQEGSGDEDAAVGGEDAAEMCIGLQRGNETVGTERDDAGPHPDPAAVFTDALPDQP